MIAPEFPKQWQGQPVTILGLSQTGLSAARYFTAQGAHCFVSEMLPATKANEAAREQLNAMGVEFECGGHTAKCFDHSDLVIISPGIPPHAPVVKQLQASGKQLISDVELAYRLTEKPMIAITGTNGKTTTTMLIEALCSQGDNKAMACGNIGIPVLDCITSDVDRLVVEVSSYQLTFTQTFKPHVAVFTNFRPDHLEWHGSLEAYKQAKCQLFLGQQAPQYAVLNWLDETCKALAQETPSTVVWFSSQPNNLPEQAAYIAINLQRQVIYKAPQSHYPVVLFNVDDMYQLPGQHNLENLLAAVAAAKLQNIDDAEIIAAVAQFKGAPHRLEALKGPNNVMYYNDSKATNVDAVLCALASFEPNSVVLIAGGKDKMTPLEPLVKAAAEKCHHVILIGEAQSRFEAAFRAGGFDKLSKVDNLALAVKLASGLADDDHPVVLSPACASFDQYPNYEARGEHFRQLVAQLALTPAS